MGECDWRSCAEAARDRIVDFCQRLVRAPSLSGHEEQAADLILGEMSVLGYDEVWRDGVGNIIGKLSGGSGRSTMLHAHMDVVDPGDVSRWAHAPFSGDIVEGYLWGRGTSDDKGSVVAQVYGGGLLRQVGIEPAGDVYVVAVVNEETGGVGTRHLIESLLPDVAIVGEPSGNTIRRGHRGRFEFVVTLRGRSAHASAPERGLNPHFSMARFLLALRDQPMYKHSVFGGSSVAPTLSYVDQTSSNVIPAEITVHLDWRNAPGETLEDAEAILAELLRKSCDPGIETEIQVSTHVITTYTNRELLARHDLASFCLDLDDPLLLAAQRAVEAGLGRPTPIDVWAFCTDGGHLYSAGVPCIGFGPGEESMAHVRDERIALDEVVEATGAYMALAQSMGESQPQS